MKIFKYIEAFNKTFSYLTDILPIKSLMLVTGLVQVALLAEMLKASKMLKRLLSGRRLKGSIDSR